MMKMAAGAVPIVGVAAAGAFAWAVRGRSSQIFGDSVWRGDTTKRLIALTFDDGPSESTPELLAMLERFGVPATFFICGRNVERCSGVAREVVARGHDVGNHSYSHPRLDFKSPEFMLDDLSRAQDTIHSATGAMPRWFRAPYGVRWFGLDAAQKKLGLTGAMWTVIGRDWRRPAAQVAERLLSKTGNGSILCLHDGRVLQPNPDIRSTLEAVERTVPVLLDRGFRFVTLSQMFPRGQ